MQNRSKIVYCNNNTLNIGDPIYYLKVGEGSGLSEFLLVLHIVSKNRTKELHVTRNEIVSSYYFFPQSPRLISKPFRYINMKFAGSVDHGRKLC